MLRFLTIIGSLTLGLLFACGDKINPQGDYQTGTGGSIGPTPTGGVDGGEQTEAGPPGNTVSFVNDVMPLLKKSCLCHVLGGEAPLLDTYSNVKTNARVSMQSIQAGDMPPPPQSLLSASDKNILQSWINAGYPNN
jgi:hypothetical protein